MSAFHFVSPWALCLLGVAPLLLVAFRYGDARRQSSLRLWGREPRDGSDGARRRMKRAFQIAACSLLAVALARPTMNAPALPAPAPASGDLVFLMDVSRSMLANDARPGRLYRARDLIRELAARAATQRLALVAFAGSQAVQCPLTMDHAFFREMVAGTSPDAVARGGSKLGDAIRFAVAHAFDEAERDTKTLVLISDGEDQENSPESAAREAARRGIRVVTIGLGDETAGALVPESMDNRTPVIYRGKPVRTRLSAGKLRAIAAAAGGAYLQAGTGTLHAATVYSAYLTPTLRPVTPIEGGDLWWLFLLAGAIVLLTCECALPERRAVQAAMLILAMLWAPLAGVTQTLEESYAKGSKAMQDRRWVDALENFANASAASPHMPEMRFNVARALYEFGSFDEAATSFEMAARMSRDPQFKAKSKLGQGNALFRQGEQLLGLNGLQIMQQAIDAYKAALAMNPDLFDAEFNRKAAERRLEEMKEKAFGRPDPPPGDSSEARAPADAARILSESRPTPAPVARGKGERVERDW